MSELQLTSVTQRSSVQVKVQMPSQSGSVQIGLEGRYSGFVQLQRGDRQLFTVQLVVVQSAPLSEQMWVAVVPVPVVTQVLAWQSVAVVHLVAVLYEQ